MADLYASRAPVRLNDGTADANNAVITNTTPGGSDYGLVVRAIMPASTTVDTELPSAAALADDTAGPTVPGVGAFAMAFDGSTWDRVRGTSADGLLVNLGSNNDVTVTSGNIVADTELPTAAQITADAQAAPTAPGVYGWLMGFNGTNWDRVRVANTGRLQVDVITGGGSNASIFVDNAAFTPDTSSITAIGGLFDDTAGTALTENDVAAARIDSKRAFVFVGEDATTRSQKWAISAAGALASNITQIGGATPSATVFLPARPTDGTAYLTRLGQTGATAQYTQLHDGTTAATVIAATAALKTDLSSVAGTATVTGGVAGTQGVAGIAAHDAAFTNVNPLLIGLASSAAAPADVSADGDVVRGWALRNGSQVVNIAAGGTLWTNMGQAAASGQFVRVTDGTLTATVRDTGASDSLNVAIVDASGNQITSFGGGTQYVGDAAATATPTGTMAMGLANAAAPADVSANNDAVAAWLLRNGSQVVNLASGGTLVTLGQKAMASSLPVVIASDQGAVSVDNTELPTTASLADATANPSLSAISGYLMGFNGTTWDRVRTANTGRLQVDVVTGGGAPPASEVPTGYNLLSVYGSTSATAAGGTATVCTNTPANTKLVYIKSVLVGASGTTKWQLKFGATVLATGFNSQSGLSATHKFDPPLTVTGDGATALTLDVTNREAAAMDLYARYGAIVQQ